MTQPAPQNHPHELAFRRTVFAICPTGPYCREDRCQSYFKFDLIPTMRAPLEECEAAGAIKVSGGSAYIVDGPAGKLSEDAFLAQVARYSPDLLIIVVTFGTLDADLVWASKLRKVFPDTVIGVRGTPCYVMGEHILRTSSAVDFCVRGEYEIVFQNIIERGFHLAAGVIFRDGDHVRTSPEIPREKNLDILPTPDRSSIDQSLYTVRGLGQAQATIRVQRGCPYPCTYCLVHTVSGSEARHRSPASIVLEMKELMRNGISCFYLRADTFSLNRTWTLETCAAIARDCPGAKWVTTTRVERVDEEVLRAMKNAGCYGISFGLDVASPAIAKHVKKSAHPELSQQVMRLCDKHGIISLAYLMIGFLWETEETLKETAQFLHAIRPDLVTIHFAHPYPGTKYFEEFRKSGVQLLSPHAQAEPAAPSMGVTIDELKAHARSMLVKHYLRPQVVLSILKKGAVLIIRRFTGKSL